MTKKPFLSGWYYLPVDLVSESELESIKVRLTARPRNLADPKQEIQIANYSLEKEGFIGLPINWALENFPHLEYEDKRCTEGTFKAPLIPTPRDDSQLAFMEEILKELEKPEQKGTLAVASTGCHKKGARVIMYNGGFKKVEDVEVGDQLLGPDGLPRTVVQLCRGRGQMYEVSPDNRVKQYGFEPFVINEDHILFIKDTEVCTDATKKTNHKRLLSPYYPLSVKDYLNVSKYLKSRLRLCRREVPLVGDRVPYLPSIPPLTMAKIITSTPEKVRANTEWMELLQKYNYMELSMGLAYVPTEYLFAPRAMRMELLTGLMDNLMDRGLCKSKEAIIYRNSDVTIQKNIEFLCMSLGMTASEIMVNNYNEFNVAKTYTIKGYESLQTLADALGISLEENEKAYYGEYTQTFKVAKKGSKPMTYYGFTLDKDHLYLTDDFIIHHNSGKTVSALYVAAKLGKKVLVTCPLTRLVDQWKEEAKDKLGLTDDDIGIIQQDKSEHHKSFVIGSMHSIAMHDYPQEVYESFPFQIMDELHIAGSPVLRNALSRFNSKYKLGLTATPDRPDGADVIYQQHIGKTKVRAKAKGVQVDIMPIVFERKEPYWGGDLNQKILSLSKDVERNTALANIIKLMYNGNRQILVIGAKIKQLETLMSMCKQLGIPEAEMGQYTGESNPNGKVIVLKKPTTIDKRFTYVLKRTKKLDREYPALKQYDNNIEFINCTQYSPDLVKGLIKGTDTEMVIPTSCLKMQVLSRVKLKSTKEQLDHIKENCRIIFATYGMMGFGVNIPRLDCGIDVTPKSSFANQIVGRINRFLRGKPKPIWVTPLDTNTPEFVGMYHNRIKQYREEGHNILEPRRIINGKLEAKRA